MIYDVVVIGGGPAGLSSSISAHNNGSKVLLIERENKLGGILKQCIHDGFGLTRYKEKLTGPEYALRDIEEFNKLKIDKLLSTFVVDIKKEDIFKITVTNENGISVIESKSIVLSTGCRERTQKQVFIHGTRPSGIYTAGNAQNLVNIMGLMPARKCIILGSGDIGLIMARRLTLEGANVLGVYEVKSTPSGLKRNISQCLDDFNIPLYLSKTVTRVFGNTRLEAVEISDVDEKMNPIKGTEKIIECDTLILSVGLIPENEIAEKFNIEFDRGTKGPIVDNNLESLVDGVFVSGNCLSVNDLVDYVSENGMIAGLNASKYAKEQGTRKHISIDKTNDFLSCVPQRIDVNNLNKVVLYLRSKSDFENKYVKVYVDGKEIYSKKFLHIRSAEAIRLSFELKEISKNSKVYVSLED